MWWGNVRKLRNPENKPIAPRRHPYSSRNATYGGVYEGNNAEVTRWFSVAFPRYQSSALFGFGRFLKSTQIGRNKQGKHITRGCVVSQYRLQFLANLERTQARQKYQEEHKTKKGQHRKTILPDRVRALGVRSQKILGCEFCSRSWRTRLFFDIVLEGEQFVGAHSTVEFSTCTKASNSSAKFTTKMLNSQNVTQDFLKLLVFSKYSWNLWLNFASQKLWLGRSASDHFTPPHTHKEAGINT